MVAAGEKVLGSPFADENGEGFNKYVNFILEQPRKEKASYWKLVASPWFTSDIETYLGFEAEKAECISETEVAEWSKAVDLGSIPKGRGFKPHLLYFFYSIKIVNPFMDQWR